MSFGLRDSDWVDPYDRPDAPMRCDECANGRRCPDSENYYCIENDEFFLPDEEEMCCDYKEW